MLRRIKLAKNLIFAVVKLCDIAAIQIGFSDYVCGTCWVIVKFTHQVCGIKNSTLKYSKLFSHLHSSTMGIKDKSAKNSPNPKHTEYARRPCGLYPGLVISVVA